ncbi:MAG: hypothetical protein HYV27_09835 [Candidatus Hydrogenedentes bacterium]|nr:hypothetical protein [Candidatus Hydrogenedentota bacterium]
MKKFLVVLGVFLLLCAGVGVGVMFKFNRDYGLTMANAVSHETRATPETRLRAVVQLDKARGYLQRILPPAEQLPPFMALLPWKPADLLPSIMPRELALLASPSQNASEIDVRLFVNERRGGPQLCKALNESTLFTAASPIQWDTGRMVMKERGILEARGAIPIPAGLMDVVRKTWPQLNTEPSPYLSSGESFFEAVLDNRNGELVTLVASIMTASGQDVLTQLKDPSAAGFMPMLASVTDVRLEANPASLDKLVVTLRLNATSAAPSGLEFIFNGVAIPQLALQLQPKGLKLEGKTKWLEKENALTGKFEITGMESLFAPFLQAPAAPPA